MMYINITAYYEGGRKERGLCPFPLNIYIRIYIYTHIYTYVYIEYYYPSHIWI